MYLLVIVFIYAFIASGLGSFQLGPVNGLVIHSALTNKRHALWIAIGGSLPEIFFSAIAYFIVDMFTLSDSLSNKITIIGSIIVILIGFWFIHKGKTGANNTKTLNTDIAIHGFKQGLLMGMLNIQLIIFWIATISFLSLYIPLDSFNLIHVLGLLIGAALGAFCTLCIYAHIAYKKKDQIHKYISISKINLLIGVILIAFGLIELILKIV